MQILQGDHGLLTAAAVLIAAVMAVLAIVYRSKLKKVRQDALVDSVTGGTNGAGFQLAVEKLRKKEEVCHSMVSMEVLNYDQIRKTFGPQESKRLLAHIHNVLRTSLGSNEPVGRMAGDVFYFLLKNRQEDEVRARLKRIYDAVNRFNETRKDTYYIDLRFGIYTPAGPDEDLLEMQGKAAEARKTPGSDLRYRFYAGNPNEQDPRDRDLVNQVDRAIQNREFALFLQPRVRLGDRRIAGAEALVRWKHPERGMLASGTFIPLLEEYHMMSEEKPDEAFFENRDRDPEIQD